MTALSQYERLESTGLWRQTPETQRREVSLFFGDATLVLADSAGRPLAHWSLPAIERLNPGEMPAILSPDPDRQETLEVDDQILIDALDKIGRVVRRERPRHGRLRLYGTAAVVVAALGLAVFWLPGALVGQTLLAMPEAKRSEIGVTVLDQVQRLSGPACTGRDGEQVLARLRNKLFGATSPIQIVIVPEAVPGVIALPGDILVANNRVLQATDDPAAFGGALVVAAVAAQEDDPLRAALHQAGLGASLRLLATGNIPAGALQAYAEGLITAPAPQPDSEAVVVAFVNAGMSPGPYAKTLPPDAPQRAALTEAAATLGQAAAPPITDGDWVALQGICY